MCAVVVLHRGHVMCCQGPQMQAEASVMIMYQLVCPFKAAVHANGIAVPVSHLQSLRGWWRGYCVVCHFSFDCLTADGAATSAPGTPNASNTNGRRPATATAATTYVTVLMTRLRCATLSCCCSCWKGYPSHHFTCLFVAVLAHSKRLRHNCLRHA